MTFLTVSAKTVLKTGRVRIHKIPQNPALASPFKASNYKSFISETLLSGKGQQTA